MKKLTLLIAFSVLAFLVQSQTLKGVTIGEKYKGVVDVTKAGEQYITTTLGNIDGELGLVTLNDSTVIGMIFTSTYVASDNDILVLKYGIEQKFNIILNSNGDEYSKIKEGKSYRVLLDDENKASVVVFDKNLLNKKKVEMQRKASTDF